MKTVVAVWFAPHPSPLPDGYEHQHGQFYVAERGQIQASVFVMVVSMSAAAFIFCSQQHVRIIHRDAVAFL